MILELTAQKRELLGKQCKKIRAEEKIPAVVYGPEVENQNLVLDYSFFAKLYKEAGESSW